MCLAVYRIVEKFITAYKGMQIFKGEIDSGGTISNTFFSTSTFPIYKKNAGDKNWGVGSNKNTYHQGEWKVVDDFSAKKKKSNDH